MRITVKRIHHWILYTVMFLTVITGLVFMFLMLLQCKPLSYFWTKTASDPSIEGSCMDIEIIIAMTYVYSAFAALCDFTVGILPIFLVKSLNMERRTKMAVASILGMACMYVCSLVECREADSPSASCAVIIRLPFVQGFANPDFLCKIGLWFPRQMLTSQMQRSTLLFGPISKQA